MRQLCNVFLCLTLAILGLSACGNKPTELTLPDKTTTNTTNTN
ncbi:MAG: hypothetical protein P8X74_05870 [Reinekea sp.]